MDSADREVLTAAADWLDAGQSVYLVTVVRTWGSSPRPPGSLLAVRADNGEFVGSVSGGCVEDDLVARLAAHGARLTLPMLDSYGVTREQTHKFGLPCGGRLDLVIERLAASAPLRAILGALAERRPLARRLCLTTGETSLHAPAAGADFEFDGDNLVKQFGPAWRLLLIGAGQLSRFVAEIGRALDYEIVVCEPREEYVAGWRVEGVEIDTRMPDDAVRARVRDARTAVLALTHDPRIDDLALVEALNAPAFYVGALGSRVNAARRRARLAQMGLSAAALARLHAPIGLPLGSRTPAEIAVAILAALTACRHGVVLQVAGQIDSDSVATSVSERESCGESRVSC